MIRRIFAPFPVVMPMSMSHTLDVVHLYSAVCLASEALFVNHLHSAPSQGHIFHTSQNNFMKPQHVHMNQII